MNALDANIDRRQTRRFQNLKAASATIKFDRGNGQGRDCLQGKIVDLSENGAKLSVADVVPMDSSVELDLEFPDPDMAVTTNATTCWSRSKQGKQWWLGCVFNDRIAGSKLTKLYDAGFIERRQDVRFEIELDGAVSWESSRDWSPATVIDYSVGGFCLISCKPPKPGTRILLWLATPDAEVARIPAVVRWDCEHGEKFKFGCSFVNRDSFPVLLNVLDQFNLR